MKTKRNMRTVELMTMDGEVRTVATSVDDAKLKQVVGLWGAADSMCNFLGAPNPFGLDSRAQHRPVLVRFFMHNVTG